MKKAQSQAKLKLWLFHYGDSKIIRPRRYRRKEGNHTVLRLNRVPRGNNETSTSKTRLFNTDIFHKSHCVQITRTRGEQRERARPSSIRKFATRRVSPRGAPRVNKSREITARQRGERETRSGKEESRRRRRRENEQGASSLLLRKKRAGLAFAKGARILPSAFFLRVNSLSFSFIIY